MCRMPRRGLKGCVAYAVDEDDKASKTGARNGTGPANTTAVSDPRQWSGDSITRGVSSPPGRGGIRAAWCAGTNRPRRSSGNVAAGNASEPRRRSAVGRPPGPKAAVSHSRSRGGQDECRGSKFVEPAESVRDPEAVVRRAEPFAPLLLVSAAWFAKDQRGSSQPWCDASDKDTVLGTPSEPGRLACCRRRPCEVV